MSSFSAFPLEPACDALAQPLDPCAAPRETVVVLPYLVDERGAGRLVCLPMVGLVRDSGVAVPPQEARHLRHVLTRWARARRLWHLDPNDGQAYPFSALQVFEPLEWLEHGRLAVATSQAPSQAEPSSLGALRLAVLPLQDYRAAAQDTLCTLDVGYRDASKVRPQRGRRARRIERLLNVTFEDLRWLRRAERLVCANCPADERALAASGVRHSMCTAALRYLGARVLDSADWLPVLERAREDEGLLHRLVELDGFLDSDMAESVLAH